MHEPVATHVPCWLWVPGRLVRMCGRPRGRWLSHQYKWDA